MKSIFFSLIVFFVFVGCSGKKYYSPQDDNNGSFDFPNSIITTPSYIKTITANGATTKDGRVINTFGISEFKLQDGYEYLNSYENQIISADKNGNLHLSDSNTKLNFNTNTIAATKKGDLLALVFSDNSFAIYDLKEKKFKLKEYLEVSYVNDTKIAMPLILNKIILFPTLDGKVIIVDNESFKVTRTLSVDLQNEVNNITLLQTVGDTLIAATPNKIISLNNGKFNTKELSIQNYVLDEKSIYVALLDGTVLHLDFDLNSINSKKFKFAKFHSIALDSLKNIYLIESQGYVIRLSSDFKSYEIEKISFFEDEKIYTNKNKIYFENKLLKLN